MHGNGEHGGFAGHIFAVVVFREAHFHIFAFVFFHAQNAFFKFGQHLALTQNERIVLRRTAVKRHAVDFAFEVDNHAVAFFGFALNAFIHGALFAQDFDSAVHFGFAHFGHHFFNFQCGEIRQLDVGVGFIHECELQIRTGSVLVFHGFDTGHGGDAQILFLGDFIESSLRQIVDGIVLDACAIHGSNHFQRCFAGTEAVDAHTALRLFQLFVGFSIDVQPRQRHGYFAFQRFCCAHG